MGVRNITILFLMLTVAYLCAVIIRIENERYAMAIGMCFNKQLGVPDLSCVRKAETRTSPLWHLYFAIAN